MRMPHRGYTGVFALALLLPAACSSDLSNAPENAVNDPADDVALAGAASGAQVKLSSLRGTRIQLYQSSCTTSFVITEFVPVIGPDGNPVIGPDGRPVPARFTVSLDGKCNLRSFGEASLAGTQQVVFNPDGTQSLHNESRYTIAEGETLYSVSDGKGALSADIPATVTFEALERFTGGTGRFENARGGAKARGSANLATAQGEYRTLGVIGY